MSAPLLYEGLTEAEVILALHNGTRPLGMGHVHNKPGFSLEDAQAYVDHAKEYPAFGGLLRFDYVCGRPLKVALDPQTKELHRADLYDRDAGPDACALVIGRALAEKGGGS